MVYSPAGRGRKKGTLLPGTFASGPRGTAPRRFRKPCYPVRPSSPLPNYGLERPLGPARVVSILLWAAFLVVVAWIPPRDRPGRHPASAADGAWRSAVEATIAGSEYLIQANGAGFTSPNRAQGLRFDYTPEAFTVRPSRGPVAWSAGLRIDGVYRGPVRTAVPIPTAAAAVEDGRLRFDHGTFRAEYTNGKPGMRQDFVVLRRAEGHGPLAVALGVVGELSGRLDRGNTFVLVDEAGNRRLRYSGLKAWDARGTTLESRMRWDGNSLFLEVDDAEAVYPVTIDPLSSTADWSYEPDQANTFLGESVASAGDVNGDGFGDVIVGAARFDGPDADEGRVFVFYGSATGLSATPDWTEELDQAGARFGSRVASAGDVNGDGYDDVIIGADLYDNGTLNEGAAFVYFGSATGLSSSPDWTADSGQADSAFGFFVAGAGDVNNDGFDDVLVSAYQYDNGESNEGRVYLWFGSATGPSGSPDWTDEVDQVNALLGRSVAGVGDVDGDGFDDIAAGANEWDGGQSDEGGVFIYYGSGTGPSASPDVTLEPNQVTAYFGRSVAGAGDVNGDGFDDVIVGSPGYTNGQSAEGRAWVFHGSGAGLSSSASWTFEPDQAGASLGFSTAGVGDVNADGFDDVIVGAYLYDNVEVNEGRAYLFLGSGGGLSVAADWTAEPDVADASFGSTVSAAGDVNGDGKADVLVAAQRYTDGQAQEGAVFAYYGSCEGCFGVSGTDGLGNDTGWRMFAPPVVGATRADIGDDVDLSATTGTTLYTYDGGYVPVSNDATVLDNGRGYLLYIFDDATDPIGAGGVALTLPGSAPVGDVAVGSLDVNDQWHLMGNPFGASFDLSSLDLAAQGMQTTVQIWDWSGGGSWTLVTQDAGTSDVIAKGQGFFVERADPGLGGTTLTFLAAGQTTGGTLIGGKRGSSSPVRIELHLEAEDAFGTVRAYGSTARLLFDDAASEQWDPWDASRLLPPFAPEYAVLGVSGMRGTRRVDQAQRSHPTSWAGDASFPVVVRTKGDFYRFRVRWPSLESVPPHWTLSLRDAATGAEVDLRTVDEYVIDGPVADGRLSVVIGNAEGVGVGTGDLPNGWVLEGAYPNPFNPSTTIVYHAPEASRVLLTVHDALGRRVATLVDGIVPAGKHETTFDGKGLASGVYLYALRTGSQHIVRRMTLAK